MPNLNSGVQDPCPVRFRDLTDDESGRYMNAETLKPNGVPLRQEAVHLPCYYYARLLPFDGQGTVPRNYDSEGKAEWA